jgi:PKD repeat protein
MKKILRLSAAAILLLAIAMQLGSCRKEVVYPDVLASYTFVIDSVDFRKVTFTNTSQNFSALSWNFGDGSAPSAEINPVHTYANLGTYTVSLTATSLDGKVTDIFTKDVVIADPNVMLTKLVGETSKTWKLIRDVSTGRFPIEVGPWDRSQIWWAMGRNNDELALRPCMLNDEWTFHRNGQMVFNAHGDVWATGGVFLNPHICVSEADMVGTGGEDLSAWGSGTHRFELVSGPTPRITAIGFGAYIGYYRLGNLQEVRVPQNSVTYNIVLLHDGPVDTLIIEGQYRWDAGDGGYWRHVLVHYDNPANEPPIPANQPTASFTTVVDGLRVTFTNTSTFGQTYLWEFGDGTTSTAVNPVHTYAQDGFYRVRLTATNANGNHSVSQNMLVSITPLTDALLQGGPWRVRLGERTVFVGPGLGNPGWWSVPVSYLDGTETGTNNWSCMLDDEFTFSSGGVFTYNTNGSARNDGYFGSPNGCWTDAQIAASGNGAYFGSGTHSYTFTPASGTNRARIILTNGPNRAAFIGFSKGFFGGENTNNANPPNGGRTTNEYEVMGYARGATMEYLFITVDITPDHSGGAAWSVILERPR